MLQFRAQYAAVAATAILLASCADTVQYIAPDDEQPVPIEMPAFGEVCQRWMDVMPALLDYKDTDEVVPTDPEDPDYDNFIENQDFKLARYIGIHWDGDQVTVDNSQAEKGVEITVNGGYVVIRNLESEAGADDARGKVTYLLSGKSDNGQLKVYSRKKFQLLLNGLELTCPDGPAISIQEKKRCFITLVDGTSSKLQDAEVYASDEIENGEDEKGCLFSEGQLIISGAGTLRVHGQHQHGIASDEYVRIHPGCEIWINAAKDGIHTKQQYHQTGSVVCSYAHKDGLQSDSLGIQVTGGLLYLFGERAMTANAGGQILLTPPAQVCRLSWDGAKIVEE